MRDGRDALLTPEDRGACLVNAARSLRAYRAEHLPQDTRDANKADAAHYKVVKLLTDAGWSIDAVTDSDSTALEEAARRGDVGRVEDLVTLGADVHRKDSLGNTALTWAAGALNLKVVHALEQAGAAVTCREAALIGDNETLLATIGAWPDINAAREDGYTLIVASSVSLSPISA